MNSLSLRSPLILALLATICLVLIGATVAIVPETSEAVVVRFGKVVDVYNPYRARQVFGQTGAGLKLRVPVIDSIVWIDKRVQALTLLDQPLRSADQQPLRIDAVARYRIVEPQRFYASVGGENDLTLALRPTFSAVLQNTLGKRTFDALLSPERGTMIPELRADLGRAARRYGVEIVDVQLTRTALPEGAPLQGALQRMSEARLADATAIRDDGNSKALEIRAQADADAMKIYAESFGRDLQFYDFYRAMQSYRTVFAGNPAGETNMVLSPDNDYLRQFRGR